MEIYGKEENRATWAMHYAQVKANIKQPKRTHSVVVSGTTKAGKPYEYEYKYADLADVDEAVMTAIKKVKDKDGNIVFSYFFDITTDESQVAVQTILIDCTGFTVKTNKVVFKNNRSYDAQATASLLTYAKRYSLSGAFGISADDDDDAKNYKTISDPKPLTKQEIKEYTVYYNGIQANLMDLYQEASEGIEDARNWLKASHTAQDAQAIHQVAEMFKKKKALQKKDKKSEELKKATEKIKTAAKEEPKKEDPFADKATGEVPSDIDDLFNN